MAEMYRVPKALREQAESLDTDLALTIRGNETVTLETVVEIRDAFDSSWAKEICNKVTRDAAIVSQTPKETRMAPEGTPDLIEELTECLGDVVSIYFRAHGAHWNVKGPDFSEYHNLFNEIYEDIYSSIDPIAENLRKLGAAAPFKLADFMALSELPDTNVGSDARALAADLLAANDIVLDQLSDVFECATRENQQGIANFIAERLDMHQKWKWQLSSSLGVDIVEPNPDPLDPSGVDPDDQEDAVKDWTAPDLMPRSEEITVETQGNEESTMQEERKVAIASAERITMNAEVRAVSAEDGSLRIAGYAATFNSEATGLNFREVIAPGAFTRTLQSGNPVFLLVNHDMEAIPLASTQSGTLRLSQDKVGLRMEADLDPANPKAQELASALKRGDVDKMSFAFSVGPDGQTREEGLRTLTDLDLFEVSVVTWPAYDSTSASMRSATEEDLDLRKRQLALKFNQYSLRKKRKG